MKNKSCIIATPLEAIKALTILTIKPVDRLKLIGDIVRYIQGERSIDYISERLLEYGVIIDESK